MAPRTHAERRATGLDGQRIFRGGSVDPAAIEAQLEANYGAIGGFVLDFAFGELWSRPGLSRRDRSLVVLSVLATLNLVNQLGAHVRGGINHGLTRAEIEEIFIQLSAYAGFPRAIDALTAARQTIAELQGVTELEALPAERPRDDGPRTEAGRDTMVRLMANQPPGGPAVDMRDFSGPAFRFAFGDIWSRPQLSRRDRSLVVCATLTTQDKPNELRIHLQAALNHGVTIDELAEVLHTVLVYAGFPTAVQGYHALAEVEARQP